MTKAAFDKIAAGLKDAIDGNFARVTIEGQTWVRLDAEPPPPTWKEVLQAAPDASLKELAIKAALADLPVNSRPEEVLATVWDEAFQAGYEAAAAACAEKLQDIYVASPPPPDDSTRP
jgi:hypothetical protein